MERLTHKRKSGMKTGYWSPNKKQELVDRLAMYEDREEGADFGKWIPCSERLPKDAVWQGRVWSKEQLYSVCGLGTVTGLLGVNCYHTYYPFFPGLSERNWTDEWLDAKNLEESEPKNLAEITQVYENTSTETDELESQSTKKLQELCSKKIFGMDIAKLGIDVGIGDIVGGRDYLTGMYSSRPVANIIYSVTNRVESKEYELEGESDNGNS